MVSIIVELNRPVIYRNRKMVNGWAIRQAIKRKLQPVARVVKQQAAAVKIKAKKGRKRARDIRKRGVTAARNAILPVLPGVSKLIVLKSPVPHLLSSNDPPQEEDVVVARTAIEEVEREEERMRSKLLIRSLGRDIGYWSTVTKHKIQQTSEFIHRHRGVISPLRTLPPEILQEIFLSAVHMKQHSQWSTVAEVPWILGQVCRSWRMNALALSALWSRLPTMDLAASDHPARTKLQLEYLGELLRRSGSAPLEVHLFSLGFKGFTHPVIDLLIRHCERWQFVTVKIDISMLYRFRDIKGRLPNLQSLSLYLSGYGTDVPAIDIFDCAPRLRQVDVGGPFLADLSLPFSQLSFYKDRMRMRNSITRVVTSANFLESLTILELCETSGTPPIPIVTLPYLRKLQVKFCCTRPDFLINLRIPIIEEIQMVSYHDRGSLLSTLTEILTNSSGSSPLKVLRFRTHAVQMGQLPDLLRLTPHLIHLNMPLPHESDIEALVTQPIVPCLESCEFFVDDVAFMSHDRGRAAALNNLASSRCEMHRPGPFPDPARLRSLELHFDRSRWIPKQKTTLEGWEPAPASLGASEYLRGLRLALHEEVPELELCPLRRRKKFDKRRVGKVKEILNLVEGFDWVEVGEIYVRVVLSLLACLKGLTARQPDFGDSPFAQKFE